MHEGDLAKNVSQYTSLRNKGFTDPRAAALGTSSPYSKGNFTAMAVLFECLPGRLLPDTSKPIVAGSIETAESYFSHPSNAKIEYKLSKAFVGERGKRYVIAIWNTAPMDNPRGTIGSQPEALKWLSDNPKSGAASINGSYTCCPDAPLYDDGRSYVPKSGGMLSAMYADDSHVALVSNDGQSWTATNDQGWHPLMGVGYSDGKVRGPLHYDYKDQSVAVDGSDQVRIRFTPDEDIPVRGIEIGVGYSSSKIPNGSSMAATIEGLGVSESASFKPDMEQAAICRMRTSKDGQNVSGWARNMATNQQASFNKVQVLKAGNGYTLTLSAGAGYNFYLSQPMYSNDAGLIGARCEKSTDGGKTWNQAGDSTSDTFGWLLLLDGGPDKMPTQEFA